MKFAQTYHLLAELLTIAMAQLPQDVFDCNNLGKNCFIEYNITSDVYTCSCLENSDLPHLGDFYTRTNYHGYLWQGFGHYGSCINLPTFWIQNSESFQSAIDPRTVCCVYTDYNCNTVGHDSTQIDGDGTVSDFAGFYEDGVISFRCSLYADADSFCTDDQFRKFRRTG